MYLQKLTAVRNARFKRKTRFELPISIKASVEQIIPFGVSSSHCVRNKDKARM